MNAADVLASFTNAVIGGTVLISVVLMKRIITRKRRQRRFANRRFIQVYRADHPGSRYAVIRAPVPSSRRLVVQLSTSTNKSKPPTVRLSGFSGQRDTA